MLLSIKLPKFLKTFIIMTILGLSSAGFAMDKEAFIAQLTPLNTRLKAVPHDERSSEIGDKAPQIGESYFIKKEHSLIVGRQLNLWGVALFSANDLVGDVIRTATGFKWSHLGMILIDEKDKTQYLLQATGSAKEILEGVYPQVQISEWDEEAKSYNGKVAFRPLIFADVKPQSQGVMNYLHDNLGRSYETDMAVLIRAIKGKNKVENSNMSTLFCSEMGADLLAKLGFWDSTQELASNCLPGHFSTPNAEKYVKLINGASLGNQVTFKDVTLSCCTIM